jgi:hypothetical protein
MPKQTTFPLRLAGEERRRGKRLAGKLGLSENRPYSDLIQEGLLIREQMTNFEKLRELQVPGREGVALLEMARDIAPGKEDRLAGAVGKRPKVEARARANATRGRRTA